MKTAPFYHLINPVNYLPHLAPLVGMLPTLEDNWVSYKNEIHKDSRFAICHYKITYSGDTPELRYDAAKSKVTSHEKKTKTDPSILDHESVRQLVLAFLSDIGDTSLTKVEVKLIQTDVFPFAFNPHRDSQFRRLKRIAYLATVLVSAGGIDGGEMQLFHAENDKLGPFTCIETLPALPGAGYIVYEPPHVVFHGMTPATKIEETAHRAALLLRFFQ
jgi:hypothetical protein